MRFNEVKAGRDFVLFKDLKSSLFTFGKLAFGAEKKSKRE